MERTYTLHDLMAALKRRRMLALVVAAAVLVIGVVAIFGMPSEYSATASVQVERRVLPVDFFPAQSGASFEDRMRTVKHGVLARPLLERVIRETDFYPSLRDDMDEAISRMRRNVEVRLEGEIAGGPPALLFVIEVHGRDPKKVAKAAELLPRYYADLTREVLQAQARSLRETLQAQTAEMGKALTADEAKVLAFKIAHQTELPEMVETNSRSAARVQGLVDLHLGLLADLRRRRLEALAMIPEGPSEPGMASAALDAALRRVQGLEASYGPDHPDVKRARREWQEAMSRRDDELQRFRSERIDEQLKRLDGEAREHESTVKGLQAELVTYQKRIDAAPRWAQELSAMTRDYEVLRAKYVAMVSRSADAAAGEALLASDDPGLFRTVEGPAVPMHPVAPDRPKLLWIVVLLALAGGLGAAGLAEWLDASMRGPEDAGSLGVPVLAAIPRIGPGHTRAS
jgi:uncharacterized protein involved in exopolysaccharide biosynthesis